MKALVTIYYLIPVVALWLLALWLDHWLAYGLATFLTGVVSFALSIIHAHG